MPPFGRLIKIWALGRALSISTPFIYRMLFGLAAILVLTTITCVLIAGCILGGLYFSYHELILHGFTRYQSVGIIAASALAVIGIFVFWAWVWWQRVHKASRRLIRIQTPFSWRAGRVVNAFIQGLMGRDG